MDLTYKQELGVGAMVLAGIALFIFGLFWFSGRSVSHRGITARVAFANVAGLKEGDPVLVSGVKVGRVSEVALERQGRVVVTLELASERWRPHTGATASVSSIDFFGTKFIEYGPGAADGPPLPDTAFIAGARPPDITDLAAGLADSARKVMGGANRLLSAQLSTDLHNTLLATQRGMTALTDATKGPAVSQATKSLAELEHVLARLDTMFASADAQRTGMRLDTLTANLSRLTGQLASSSASLDTLLGKINRGQGTLGKMATDTVMYGDIHRTLDALTNLLNDLRERPGRYLTVKIF